MTANTSPIYPLTPAAFFCDLVAVTACTTRAPTVTASLAAANIFVLVPAGVNQSPASTAGTRIDQINVQAASSSITATTAAQIVTIWWHDGTTARPWDEIIVTAVAPSTTAAAYGQSIGQGSKSYTKLVLPLGHALYASTTVTTTASTTALVVEAIGGTY